MAKSLLLVWTSPVDNESEPEFNVWYEQTHIPQVRSVIPSITEVNRYRTSSLPEQTGAQQPVHRYLTVYELDSDDVSAAADALGAAGLDGTFEMTTAMDLSTAPPVMQWYCAAE